VNDAFAVPQFFRANFVRNRSDCGCILRLAKPAAGVSLSRILSGAALAAREVRNEIAADCVSTTCGRGAHAFYALGP